MSTGIAWDEFPELLDRPTIARRLGLRRCDIDRIFDRSEVYRVPGSSKPYVRRADVQASLTVRAPAPRRAA